MSRTRAPGALTAVALIVAAGVLGFVTGLDSRHAGDSWAPRVYRVCQQYAGLDLSGMASLCADAGYQERVYTQPTGAPPYWPTVARLIQPEDLN